MKIIKNMSLVLGLSVVAIFLGNGSIPGSCFAELPEFTKTVILNNVSSNISADVDHYGNWHVATIISDYDDGSLCLISTLRYINNSGFKDLDNRKYCYVDGHYYGEKINKAELKTDPNGGVHIWYTVLNVINQDATLIHTVAPKYDGLVLP